MFPGSAANLEEKKRQYLQRQQQQAQYPFPPQESFYPPQECFSNDAYQPLPPYSDPNTQPPQQNSTSSSNDIAQHLIPPIQSYQPNFNNSPQISNRGEFVSPTSVNFEAPPQDYINQTQGLVSNCQGRKKALLIGINYRGTKSELRGCVSDVKYVRDFITSVYGFSTDPKSMLVLTDDHNDPSFLPLRNNIIQAMHWLIRDAQPGDSLFFQFSGHGTKVKDLDGDEEDGYDEAICPLDYNTAGLIIDDEINAILIRNLPPNVRLTAISDSCHSGSVLDLPYTYTTTGELKITNKAKMFAKSAAPGVLNLLVGNKISGIMGIVNSLTQVLNHKSRDPHEMATYKGNYFSDTILISGCKDDQTSADTVISGRNTGALTHAFVDTLKLNPHPTYRDLLIGIRNTLKGSYSQKPQMSTGRLIDMNNSYFII